LDTSLAETLLDLALKEGADEAEVYLRTSKNLSIEVNSQQIDTLEKSDSTGYSVRVFKDKRLGFSYSTDPAEIRKVARQAVEASRFAEPDECNVLPRKDSPSVVAVYDSAVSSLNEKAAITLVMSMEKAAIAEDSRIKKTRSASGSFGSSTTRIINSKGVDGEFSATTCSGSIMAVAEDIAESQMAWEYNGSRFLNDISFEAIGRKAAIKAVQLLGAKKTAPFKGHILLDPSVAADFLGVISSALSSESVQKKKSLLAGKSGQTVISNRLNIIDSGLLPGKLGSRPFDAEGVPTREKKLIENGVLKAYLYNTYTALKEGTDSTGNAARGGFANIPGVGASNIFFTASSGSYSADFASLLAMIDKGIYVTDTMGMHTANPISGEYSVGISGLKIENGCMTYPVKEAVISGNILDLFSSVIMIGEDIHFYGNIGASHILAANIDISG
jgi:PmbA protein